MTRAAVVVVVLSSLGVAGSAGAATQDTAQAQRPSLAVTDMRPFEVRGVGFEPRERVQVLLAVNGGQRWQGTVATARGVFTVRFPVSIGSCSRFMIKALGSRGSSARIVPRGAQIDCVFPASGGSPT
jgi:hypothetical protein